MATPATASTMSASVLASLQQLCHVELRGAGRTAIAVFWLALRRWLSGGCRYCRNHAQIPAGHACLSPFIVVSSPVTLLHLHHKPYGWEGVLSRTKEAKNVKNVHESGRLLLPPQQGFFFYPDRSTVNSRCRRLATMAGVVASRGQDFCAAMALSVVALPPPPPCIDQKFVYQFFT
jgi:hypothetical protein